MMDRQIFYDFHTHAIGVPCDTVAMVSSPYRAEGMRFWSQEIHPWYIAGEFDGGGGVDLLLSGELRHVELDFAMADAVGEIGLDKLRGSAYAAGVWRSLLPLAAESGKAVIFHCVRSWPELSAEVKKYPAMRKIFHGFNGKTEFFRELRRHGFFILLGERALRRRDLELCEGDWPYIGLESDDSGVLMSDLYRLAPELPECMWGDNFRKIYGVEI